MIEYAKPTDHVTFKTSGWTNTAKVRYLLRVLDGTPRWLWLVLVQLMKFRERAAKARAGTAEQ